MSDELDEVLVQIGREQKREADEVRLTSGLDCYSVQEAPDGRGVRTESQVHCEGRSRNFLLEAQERQRAEMQKIARGGAVRIDRDELET